MKGRSPTLFFESTAFPVVEGGEDETLPGVFGKSLAEWLQRKLDERGIKTSILIAEDYGWLVGIASEPHLLYVACSNADETHFLWKVFVEVEDGPMSSSAKKDKSPEALQDLHRSVKEILSTEPAVKFLRERA